MLYDFVMELKGYMKYLKRFSNSIIMSLIYGMRMLSIKMEYMVWLYSFMENWSKVMEVGNILFVDIFFFLKLVLEGLLGNWRLRVKNVGKEMIELYLEWVEKGI